MKFPPKINSGFLIYLLFVAFTWKNSAVNSFSTCEINIY